MMGEGIRVLCVDDESPLLEAGKRFLELNGGFIVDTASSATAALDILRGKTYDAIVCDYQMPAMDGIAFLKEVRTTNTNIPFILLTGKGREDVAIGALNNGANFYLQKGGSPQILYSELSRVIRQAVAIHQTMNTLAEQEQRFLDIRNTNDLIQSITPDGRFLFVNQKWLDTLGYREEDLPRLTLHDIVHKDSSRYCMETFSRVISGENVGIIEAAFQTKEGKKIYIEGIASCRMKDGRCLYTRGLFKDITRRKEAERGLFESENKFATVFKRNPVPLTLVAASDGVFVDVNDTFLVNTGFHRDEVIGKTASELGLFVDPKDYSGMIQELRTAQVVRGREIRCRIKTGGTRICRFSSSIIMAGDEPHILSTIEDITEYKHQEDAIRESSERYRLILENAHDGVLINEVSPDGPGRILDTNDRACRLFGLNREQILEMRFIDLIHAGSGTQLTDVCQELVTNNHALFQIRYRTREMPEKVLDFSVSLFDLRGQPTMLSVVRDITRQKESDSAIHALVQGIVGTTGRESLDRIAQSVSSWLKADCTMIGEIAAGDDQVSVLSMILDGEKIEGSRYFLKGTPCEKTAENGFCVYSDEVSLLFPDSIDLKKFQIRGYLGTPLRSPEGNVNGILCVLTKKPLYLPYNGREIIDIIAAKASAEIARLHTVRALAESEEKFRSLVEYSLDGILILDLTGRILFANPAAGCIVESDNYRDLTANANILDFFAPESHSAAMQDFQDITGGGEGFFSRYRILTLKRNERWVESLGVSVSFREEPAILISIRDVTERQRAEERLKKSQEMLELVVNGVPTFISYLDTDLRFVYTNKQHATFFGDAHTELEGKKISQIFSPEECTHAAQFFRRVLTGEEVTYETPAKDAAGIDRILVVRLVPHIQNSTVVGIFAAVNDVTERRRAESALRESREMLSLVMDGVPTHLIYMDTGYRIIYLNKTYVTEWYGSSDEDLIGKNLCDIIPASAFEVVQENIQKALSGRRVLFRNHITDKNGRERTLEIHVSPHIRAGRVVGFFSVVNDITEQQRLEDALHQANKKLNLLSGITRHDINNQILSLNAYVELLRDSLPDNFNQEYLTNIRKATGRIASMVRFTKEYEKVGVNRPVWQNLSLLISNNTNAACQGDARILNEIPHNLEVFADPLITKVFFNLIDNAVRHGGNVSTIRFTLETRDSTRVILCQDDGGGVPADLKEKIFERGFGKNTGFGLSISREILDITGMTIRETGTAGDGARFEIMVPDGQIREPDAST